MEGWKSEALREITKNRETSLYKLKDLVEKADKCNAYISKLEVQMNCKHENMTEGVRAGVFGGYDMDICKDCGYEWCY